MYTLYHQKHAPTQIIQFRCFSHFCGCRCVKSAAADCFYKQLCHEQVACRSSVNFSVAL